jgi:N-acetylneuraminic acid mutarotase
LVWLVLAQVSPWEVGPPLLLPVSNNAVAGLVTPDGPAVFSFLGLDATKRWDGVTARSFRLRLSDGVWEEIAAPPGPGRLAGTAQAVGGRIFLFGGYTVAEDGSEKSVPGVDVWDPADDSWSAAAPMPVPVDDAVSGVWRDSLIVLVSGWYDRDNVADVQIFDPALDRWQAATPIPGPPVFGHAGAIAGDLIVYLDGVRTAEEQPRFRMAGSAWLGAIDPEDPADIRWTRLPDHPGPPLYRAAAVAVGRYVIFAGGSENPYNYDGIGYDGLASEPLERVFAFDTEAGEWVDLPPLPLATMDHRSIIHVDGQLLIVGGMTAGQSVTDRVVIAPLNRVLP